ncbi:hypothetical protein K438DRAFT_1805256 [Mycena galopus ATCC 62051]|nr:hypothetical protein K438DRAFT_1805256 [Mycena galopus ATCC 62051]
MRHVAIGFPAKDVVLEHWYPGLLAMPPHQDDAGIFAHLSSDTEKPHPPRQRRKAFGHTLPPPLLAAQRTTPSDSIRYSLVVGLERARLEREHELERARLEREHELKRTRLEQERLAKEKEEEEIRAKQAAEKLALKRAQEDRRAARAAQLKEEADRRTQHENTRKERQEKELAIKKAQEEAQTAQLKQEADRRKRQDNAFNKAKQKRPVPKPSSDDTRSKRKGRSESRGCMGSTKKRKLQQETVSGSFRPCALTDDPIERPMMEKLLLSIDQGRQKCFRRHVDGVVPTDPPKDEESDMYVMSLSQWNSASPVDIDKILGTGCDVFVEDLLVSGKSLPPGAALRLRHNLDVEMEVQVPGLRFLPSDAEGEKKYPNSLRKTTLRKFLNHANAKDGITLNCLKLPESSSVSPNPLTGSGLDLEDIAFRQTNGLGGPQGPFAEPEHVPREVQYWEITGTPHALTKGHWDKAPTRVTVEGPGMPSLIYTYFKRTKFRREAKWFRHEVENSRLLENWDPDEPDISTCQYEGVILLPRSGTLFMQSKEHIVVGIAPISSIGTTDPSDDSDKFTLVTGGHFLSASTTVPSATFVRICAFWIDVSMNRSSDIPFHQAYLPRFSDNDATGWMDIVSIASLVVLSTPLDGHHYLDSLPRVEASQRVFVRDLYRQWREWFAPQFKGYKDDAQIDWEQDAVLLHLAVVLRERYQDGTGPDILLGQSTETFVGELQDALDLYRDGLGESLVSEVNKGKLASPYFFKYKGPEITICRI